jgi:hypothetical protein
MNTNILHPAFAKTKMDCPSQRFTNDELEKTKSLDGKPHKQWSKEDHDLFQKFISEPATSHKDLLQKFLTGEI